MILTEKIKINISYTNLKHFSEKFKGIKIGDQIEISPDYLPETSHKKILTKCDVCGNEKELPYRDYIKSLKNGNYFTCNRCKNNKTKNTLKEKYGNENYYNKEKYKKTCLEKYGVENVFQNEKIKQKIKDKNKEKYGFEHSSKSDIVKDKSKETNLKKYGKTHHLKNKDILNKQFRTNKEKYGFEHSSQNDEVKEKISNGVKNFYIRNANNYYDNLIGISGDTIELYCPLCGNRFKTYRYFYHNRKAIKSVQCTLCNPINSTESSYEKELKTFISTNYNDEIFFNYKKISNSEFDIFLPKLKLGFEFNGLYWHSETYKDNNYHLHKTELAEKYGIRLIHVYEDNWIYKQEIVKSRILNLLNKTPNKIYARKCEIKEVSNNKLVRDFLEKNHVQGFVGSNIKIGLFYSGELVSLMTFGNLRRTMGQKSEKGYYEMFRFCNKLNTGVIGGASRLFKFFVKNYDPKEVISYADRSWSQGELYKNLGFKLVGKTKPNYYYFKNKKRLSRFNFRKDQLVREGFDSNKSEHEIMIDRGIYRIYDSGNLKFIWTF